MSATVQHWGWCEELSILLPAAPAAAALQSPSSALCTAPVQSFSLSLASFQLLQALKEGKNNGNGRMRGAVSLQLGDRVLSSA